jgi:hypothetical protein
VNVTLTCSLDCSYTVSLNGRLVRGTAVGRVAKSVVLKGRLAPGTHRITARALALVNAGSAATASTSFRSY